MKAKDTIKIASATQPEEPTDYSDCGLYQLIWALDFLTHNELINLQDLIGEEEKHMFLARKKLTYIQGVQEIIAHMFERMSGPYQLHVGERRK